MTKFTPLEELSYEQALAELENIVAGLEIKERTLEETLRFFERGQALANFCIKLLDDAELKVQTITEDAGKTSADESAEAGETIDA